MEAKFSRIREAICLYGSLSLSKFMPCFVRVSGAQDQFFQRACFWDSTENIVRVRVNINDQRCMERNISVHVSRKKLHVWQKECEYPEERLH